MQHERGNRGPTSRALAALGANTTDPPSAEELAHFNATREHLQATIAGLIQLRIELQPDVLREQLAQLQSEERQANVQLREITDRIAPLQAQLKSLEDEARGKNIVLEGFLAKMHPLRVTLEELRRGRGGAFADLRHELDHLH